MTRRSADFESAASASSAIPALGSIPPLRSNYVATKRPSASVTPKILILLLESVAPF